MPPAAGNSEGRNTRTLLIRICQNAVGYGWQQVDLLTVVTHDHNPTFVMAATLDFGQQRTPSTLLPLDSVAVATTPNWPVTSPTAPLTLTSPLQTQPAQSPFATASEDHDLFAEALREPFLLEDRKSATTTTISDALFSTPNEDNNSIESDGLVRVTKRSLDDAIWSDNEITNAKIADILEMNPTE